MPKAKQKKPLCVDELRHAEYYGMQQVFDNLYAQSKEGKIFTGLMDIILSRENILLAYRNVKTNTGRSTAGTDGLTMNDIGRLSPSEVIDKIHFIIGGSQHGYRPKPVRRKDIPKPNGSMRPLGIPCIWDRMVQQCIKQVLEPICEAKFDNCSYGFRPNRAVEHAIQVCYKYLQNSNLHYVIEFDIRGFFDNVSHSKLVKQIWAMGIRDKHLIWIIKQILKAPIKMPDGTITFPIKGTPQGGIISPLLANIVLNELDHWVNSQWRDHPVTQKYSRDRGAKGIDKGNGYVAMRKTTLKEMFIIRYADDFRILCRDRESAEKAKIAVTQWLLERLKLEVSPEKTRIVHVKRRYMEFLGFKIKMRRKGQKYVVSSHLSDKALSNARNKLVKQAKTIAKPVKDHTEQYEITLYNSMVMGIQNYYRIATCVNLDCSLLHRAVMTIFTNRLRTQKSSRLKKSGRKLTMIEAKLYGKSKMLRFVAGTNEPIYPIKFIQHRHPMAKKRSICNYTEDGRHELHNNLRIDMKLMLSLMKKPLYHRSIEYADNRISLFSAQQGKCAITRKRFLVTDDIHCHHRISRESGGTDEYGNLVLVLTPVHILIHAVNSDVIGKYLCLLKLNSQQLERLNELRLLAGREAIQK